MAQWQPVLHYDARVQALKIADELGQELRTASPNLDNPTLTGGLASRAIFFHYLNTAFCNRGHDRVALDYLNQTIDLAGRSTPYLSLHEGVVGVAWAIEHLQRRWLQEQEEDPNEEIEPALLEHLSRTPWSDDYDLIGGLVGIGVYAVERMPRPTAKACLHRVVDRLEELGRRETAGLTWHTPPSLMTEEQRGMFPDGYCNLGLAHGVPGVIAFLAKAQVYGIHAHGLLDRAVEWLLAQELPGGDFPSWIAPGLPRKGSRLAWCYGSPGVAASLLLAARATENREWEKRALAIARAATLRPPSESGVRDAGICHGACGLAHIFNRFYQATGDECFAETARYWFQQAFEMRKPGQGIGGFLACLRDGPSPEPGLLMGSAGIGLTLLAAATDIEPVWDRTLLLS